MYKCSKCNELYESSEQSNKFLPEEHILKCPHCGDENHIIGADLEYDDYGGTQDKPVFMMYGRNKKEGDEKLIAIEGKKHYA